MNRKRGYLCLILAALIYSTTEVALKMQSDMFHPMQLNCERIFIGGLFLLPFALHHIRKTGLVLGRQDFLLFIKLGFCNAICMSGLQLAVYYTDASAAAILYSGNPVFAVFLAALLLHEPVRRNHLVALGLQVIGILLVLNPAHLEINFTGFSMAMISSLVYALYNTLCKQYVPRYSTFVLNSFNLLFCSAELFILLLLGHTAPVAALYDSIGLGIMVDVPFLSGFTLKSTLAMIYVGAVVAGLGNLFTIQAANDTSATEASFIYFFKPVFATVIAVVFLHEQISTNRAVGMVFFMLASACIIFPLLKELRAERAAEAK